MSASWKNPFLSTVMAIRRKGRVPMPRGASARTTISDIAIGKFAQIWFQTSGCVWDRMGQCTMCDYGAGPAPRVDEMISVVTQAIETARREEPLGVLYVSPSGSFLDAREVPHRAQVEILRAMKNVEAAEYVFEARPELITPDSLSMVRSVLDTERVVIETGIESDCDWVLRYCHNKHGVSGELANAVRVAGDYGIAIVANIALGAAFLREPEAMIDARRSILNAYHQGAEAVILFPLHAKENTLLAVLLSLGIYRPPWLHSIAALLLSLPASLRSKTEISWYRDNSGSLPAHASPRNCGTCDADALSLLDAYRSDQDPAHLRAMLTSTCGCRNEWLQDLVTKGGEPVAHRLLRGYAIVAAEVGVTFGVELPEMERQQLIQSVPGHLSGREQEIKSLLDAACVVADPVRS